MTDVLCACGTPTHDATLCVACAYRLDDALAQVADHHGLGWDLDIAATRQDRIVRPSSRPAPAADEDRDETRQMPGTLRPTPLPYDHRAVTAAAGLHRALATWAAVIVSETYPRRLGPTCPTRQCGHPSCDAIRARQTPPVTITALAAWLRPRVGWLRHHPHGQRALDDILDAVHTARQTVDRPAEKLYAGPCDECGEDLYGRVGARIVECIPCELVYEIEARRRWLLRSAEDVLASATDISRAITRLGQPVTPAAIRGYVHRGQLLAHGQRTVGAKTVPLYRLGDVLDVLARQAARDATMAG